MINHERGALHRLGLPPLSLRERLHLLNQDRGFWWQIKLLELHLQALSQNCQLSDLPSTGEICGRIGRPSEMGHCEYGQEVLKCL